MKVTEINIEEAYKKSLEISKKKVEIDDKFDTYAPIYLGTTSNAKDTVKLYDGMNNALVVGSQGVYIFELLLKGVTEIDCFDKNILQYLYYELLKAAIKYLDFKDFERNFTTIKLSEYTQDYSFMLSSDMFFDILEKMDDPARSYWGQIFMKKDISKLLKTNLFRIMYILHPEYLRQCSSVYEKESFYKLKDILNSKDIKIDYHICDIENIHKEFESNMYDLIMFDNILQYYRSIPALDDAIKVNKYVKEKLDPMLRNGGQIQLGYGYEVVASAVSQILKREYSCINEMKRILLQNQTSSCIKNDFIPNMIKIFDEYKVDFIRGSEDRENYKAENVILTYKKF